MNEIFIFFIGLFEFHSNKSTLIFILCRKAALELEKIRAQRIAKLPIPEDPLRDLQTKPSE